MPKQQERIVIVEGPSSHTRRIMVIHEHEMRARTVRSGRYVSSMDQLAEIDATTGASWLVHLMGPLEGVKPGWRRKANLDAAIDYVINQHGVSGLPVEREAY